MPNGHITAEESHSGQISSLTNRLSRLEERLAQVEVDQQGIIKILDEIATILEAVRNKLVNR